MRRHGLMLVVLVLALAACDRSNRVPFEGEYFRATAKTIDRSDRADFEVVVRRVSKSEAGARQAGAYEATAYCIRWFGRSDVIWDVAPEEAAVDTNNDRLVLQGTCTG